MNLPEPVSNAVSWILVIGLALAAGDVTTAFLERGLQVPPKPLPAVRVAPPQANVPAQAAPPGLVALMATTKPADEPAPTEPTRPGQPSVTKAPVNPSNLRLRGTMAGAGGSGLAMIDVNGKTRVVSVGQEIEGSTLTRVSTYSARLERDGKIQLLEMDVALAMTGRNPQPTQPVVSKPVVPAQPTGETGPILTQRELRNILDNPSAYAGKGFRMKPVVANGQVVGMQVQLSSLSHPLARLGVQNGDIVKSLNGKALNGPEALTSIYRTLRNTASLRFEVDRAGQPETIQVSLSE